VNRAYIALFVNIVLLFPERNRQGN